jgi:hypothetical protein
VHVRIVFTAMLSISALPLATVNDRTAWFCGFLPENAPAGGVEVWAGWVSRVADQFWSLVVQLSAVPSL